MSDLSREPSATEFEVLPPPTGASESLSTHRGANPSPGSPSSSSSDADSTVGATKDEAKQVRDTLAESGTDVAETAVGEAKNVAAETKQQAVSLLDTVRSEVGDQANTSQNRIADTLHSLSKELGGMAESSSESGPLTDLARQTARKGGEIAHWLQDREPSDVLEKVRAYARRRPGTFLLLCGVAGVVAGRLTRGAVASRTNLDSDDDSKSAGTRPALGRDHAAIGRGSDHATESGVSQARQVDAAVADAEDARVAPPPASGYFGATSTWVEPTGGPNR